MDEKLLQVIVEKAATAAASKTSEQLLAIFQTCPFDKDCPCDTEAHRLQHEWVREMIQVMRQLNRVKWGVIKAVAIALTFVLLGILGVKGIKG